MGCQKILNLCFLTGTQGFGAEFAGGAAAKAGQQLSLHTWENNDAASLWSIENTNGGVRFRNKANPNLIIDVNNGWKSSVGNRINLWTQNNSDAQTFYLQRA